ncbi:MAG TPA: hypothetical protein VEA99_13325 [Gemmatimonadaceae bacterium]|nr:hypothetical protein [Gemmatimonadaceae bacterium]
MTSARQRVGAAALRSMVVLMLSAGALEAQDPKGGDTACWRGLGPQPALRDADAAKQLLLLVASTDSTRCSQVGFDYATNRGRGLVAYDRQAQVLVWRSQFPPQGVRTTVWTNVSEATLLGADVGQAGLVSSLQQHAAPSGMPLPTALRGFVRRHGGVLGG